jgi:CHAD domain
MKARRVKKLDADATLAENAARIVRVRLDELRSFAPAALEPRDSKAQHDMRIAAKRLRYVLEVTEPCLGESAVGARRRAKELQGLLGDLHDCDVMMPTVEAHLAQLRDRDAEAVERRAGGARDLDPRLIAAQQPASRGLDVLAVYVKARRGLLFNRFAELWRAAERDRTWDALDLAAADVLAEARTRRRAAKRARRAARDLVRAERRRREAASRAIEAASALDRVSKTGPSRGEATLDSGAHERLEAKGT